MLSPITRDLQHPQPLVQIPFAPSRRPLFSQGQCRPEGAQPAPQRSPPRPVTQQGHSQEPWTACSGREPPSAPCPLLRTSLGSVPPRVPAQTSWDAGEEGQKHLDAAAAFCPSSSGPTPSAAQLAYSTLGQPLSPARLCLGQPGCSRSRPAARRHLAARAHQRKPLPGQQRWSSSFSAPPHPPLPLPAALLPAGVS